MAKHSILFIAVIILFACKSDKKAEETAETTTEPQAQMSELDNDQPAADVNEPCSFLTYERLSAFFEIEKGKFEVKPDNKRINADHGKSCVARWLTSEILRGKEVGAYKHRLPGISIQLNMWNGQHQSANWAANRTQRFIDGGVPIAGSDLSYEFVKKDGVGDLCVWSGDLSQLSWHSGNKAFDINVYAPIPESERIDIANKIAAAVMAAE